MNRSLRLFVVLASLGLLLAAARGSGEPFDFDTLRYRAKLLAEAPFAQPASVPDWLSKLSYDDLRRIRFNPARSLWRREDLPFQVQFFHPGYIFNHTVQVFELKQRHVEPVDFDPGFFDYDTLKVGPMPPTMGFAGLRLLYPLNHPGDELGAFLGASYFRFLPQKAYYGLSARGIAVNTGGQAPEEFPRFTQFWLERPSPKSRAITVYALLEGESVAGAYRFTIAPGAETVMQVRAALYFRHNAEVIGIAPLTSMYWYGENSMGTTHDFRPEVHDSDGLLLNTGAGEWLWRPLTNPPAPRVAVFADNNPRGFGLLQRDRNFENYQDLEAHYQLRPSAWVEPVGNWGNGAVRLFELPTVNEFNDNIVAFWVPDKLPPSGEPLELEYRLHWVMDQVHPPAGYVVATRHGRRTDEPDFERFVVDFDGPYLNNQPADPAIESIVTVGAGAKLAQSGVQKNTYNGTWRASFAIKPDGSGRPVELRCFLRKSPHVLTETWSYLWQP
jgi:glucans biosynthesis protein